MPLSINHQAYAPVGGNGEIGCSNPTHACIVALLSEQWLESAVTRHMHAVCQSCIVMVLKHCGSHALWQYSSIVAVMHCDGTQALWQLCVVAVLKHCGSHAL
eukprot:1161246-Pelagomonas_calceolata.AAC.3